MLTDSQVQMLKDLALKLNVNYDWLYNLIKFESGFDPLALNGKTNAVGLIQFMPSTLQSLFHLTTEDIFVDYGTFEKQLPLLEKYFSQYIPFPTKQSLYMAVFYPAYRNVSSDTVFSSTVQKYNPGIKTVQDYINKVDGVFMKAATTILPLLLIIGIAGYILYKKYI